MTEQQTFLTTPPANGQVEYHAEIKEDEALTKLCIGPPGCGIEDIRAGRIERRCAGSRCMAWRWGRDIIEVGHMMVTRPPSDLVHEFNGRTIAPPVPAENLRPEGEGWYLTNPAMQHDIVRWQRFHAQRGYCGFIAQLPTTRG